MMSMGIGLGRRAALRCNYPWTLEWCERGRNECVSRTNDANYMCCASLEMLSAVVFVSCCCCGAPLHSNATHATHTGLSLVSLMPDNLLQCIHSFDTSLSSGHHQTIWLGALHPVCRVWHWTNAAHHNLSYSLSKLTNFPQFTPMSETFLTYSKLTCCISLYYRSVYDSFISLC